MFQTQMPLTQQASTELLGTGTNDPGQSDHAQPTKIILDHHPVNDFLRIFQAITSVSIIVASEIHHDLHILGLGTNTIYPLVI